MGPSFLFASDLHGNLSKIDGLLNKASESGYPPVILGGDLFRSGRGNDEDSQIKLLRDDIEPRISEYNGDVFTIFGNNDWRSVCSILDEIAPSLISLQGKDNSLENGVVLKGLSYVPVSPFMIKDWERLEKFADNENRGRREGLCSNEEGLIECTIDPDRTMWDEIMELGSLENSILVSHGPPFGICSDLSGIGVHLGSMDLTRKILIDPPVAVLCGHIHEAPFISGKPICSMGDTIIGNPGSDQYILSYFEGGFEDDKLFLEHHMEDLLK